MKRLLLLFAFAQIVASALFAQDVTGTWQGILQAGNRELRTVVKISKGDGSAMKAVFYSIDQSAQGLPVNTVTLQSSVLKMAIPAIGGSYEGKLDSDGVNLTGTFTQGGTPLPLNLKLVKGDDAWKMPEAPARMAANATPGVDVATIKPSKADIQGKLFTFRGGAVTTLNTTLSDLMTFAWDLHARQIVDAPAWVESEHYDVVAKPDTPGQPGIDQMKIVVQKLLADRFGLKFHKDKKELTVYALVVGKNGPKMAKDETNPNGPPGLIFRGLGNLPAVNASMAEFAAVMQQAVLNRPVVDQTGLKGKYDFQLKWTPDESQFAGLGAKVPPPSGKDTDPDLFTAIQEQMGLKLESTKAPVEVLVIDHVDKPSAN